MQIIRERWLLKVEIMIMSGVDDGLRLTYSATNGDGQSNAAEGKWTLSIGRREDSDVCLRNDSFVSRQHAYLHWDSTRWWLEDCNSRNGTFIEEDDADARVTNTIPINAGDLFRVGHTWMRIQPAPGDSS